MLQFLTEYRKVLLFFLCPLTYLCAMELLDGKLASAAIKEALTLKVAQLSAEGKKVPHLAAVLIGNNGASETYVGAKVKTCAAIGYKSTLLHLEETVSENTLLSVIQDLNWPISM